MKRVFLLLIVSLAAAGILVLSVKSDVYAATYPDTVKIGIYYGSDSVPSVSFSAKSGMDIGAYGNGTFTKILSVNLGISVIIRKDAYFIKSAQGVTSEYNPSEGVPFAGDKIGPYHIQIGGAASDYNAAASIADVVRKSGIAAYPVYENGWYVWSGFYADPDIANAGLVSIADKLGTAGLTVVPPANSRVVVLSSAYEPILLFGDPNSKLRVKPGDANNPYCLSANGRQYRGEFEIRRYLDSDMTIINIVNIEQYLYGVVPGELESTAPLEALKAQAVAARTYTYMNMGKYGKWGFDLSDTSSSQVYSGYDAEKPATNIAVDQTKGIKALYNGKLASLYYFSSSGGMTESNENVWKGNHIPYLNSVPDPYESGKSYNYNWTKTFTAEDIKRILFLSNVEIGDIVSVTTEAFSPAGRVTQLKFVGTEGQITYYEGDGKTVLGLPSQLYTVNSGVAGANYAVDSSGSVIPVDLNGAAAVSADGTQSISQTGALSAVSAGGVATLSTSQASSDSGLFVFTGKGWGHAVGMSQEGAKGFALQGYTYDQILKHYYTGITVE